jgi:AcrR family transcriptional regulator
MCPLSRIAESLSEDALPRWRRRKEARPQEIVAAALDLFVERGYAATRAEDVAARAGVSKGTVYLYFTNKEGLFQAVVREGLLPVIAEATALLDQYEGSTFDLMDELYWGWWERVGETKLSGIMKLMMSEAGNFPELATFYHAEFIMPANRMMAGVLERGIQRGEFRAVNVSDMVHVMIAPMLLLFLWKNSFGVCGLKDIDPRRHVQTSLDLLKHGLASPGAVFQTKPAPGVAA